MLFTLTAVFLSAGMFVGMLLMFEAGRRIGRTRLARDPEATQRAGPVESSIFGLFGLLLAFTFSGAASRFEDRRHLIVEEANAIGTAYLRVDLLPRETQPEIRQLFRRYIGARITTYHDVTNETATDAALAESMALQGHIWSASVAATQQSGVPVSAATLMLPALNAMIDITTTRVEATKNHPPSVIFVLLECMGLLCALLGGYGMASSKSRNWFYMLLVTVTTSVTMYVILDLEYPRLGLIRIDSADQVLVELQSSMR